MKTFSSDEVALLATIHADPRNDTPRLVYADWLDEHEQREYAEFIRLQCRTAGEAVNGAPSEYSPRERYLLKKHEVRWRGVRLKPHSRIFGDLYYRGFRRGLPNVEWSIGNDTFESDSSTRTFAHVAPHYQLFIWLNIYPISDFNAVSMLVHPIFSRAHRILIVARGGTAATLPHDVVAAIIEVFRPQPRITLQLGPLTDDSAEVVVAQLPNYERITPLPQAHPESR